MNRAMYEDPKSKISQLEKVLDAREDRVSKKIRRHELKDREMVVNKDWDDEDLTQIPQEIQPKNSIQFSFKILIGSIIFFVLALGIVAYRFLGGGSIVSGDNIEITVKAPISVAGGETWPFELEIVNRNSVALKGADLSIVFPASARQVEDPTIPAKRIQEFIGNIDPGQSIKKNMGVILFGPENEKQEININLEYKVTGSNSQFNKVKKIPVLISTAPATIVVKAPKEINTDQSVDFQVEVTSNSATILKGLLLKVEYPFGFSYVSSDPKPFTKNNLWLIGDLGPGQKRTITISGFLKGQEGEERGFNFSLGVQSKTDNQVLDTPFTSAFSSVVIRRPFVSADILLDDKNDSEVVASAGEKIEALIKWKNNLSYQVSDVALSVKIEGNSIDKSSIQVEGGFYRSSDNTIIFNKTTDPVFAKLEPGQSGESSFIFQSFGAGSVTGSSLSNPIITLNVSVTGKRLEFGGSRSSDVLFSDSRKVKITSNPQLFGRALYYIGPFSNTGPIPPKAETETTYTIVWTVTNPLNNLTNVQVRAVLPPYIKWLDQVSPDREKFNYNPDTGEVVWNVGNVSAGAGTISAAREAAFRISFLPSVSQIESIPDLIGQARLEARDAFTQTMVTDIVDSLTSDLKNDPYFKVDSGIVVK